MRRNHGLSRLWSTSSGRDGIEAIGSGQSSQSYQPRVDVTKI